jgi:hypothetical protein
MGRASIAGKETVEASEGGATAPSGPRGKRARTAEGESAELITIRSVAYDGNLLDGLPQGERDAVLMEATRQFAEATRVGGGVERSVLENNTLVGGYPEDVYDCIVETLCDIIVDRGRAIGPLTVATVEASEGGATAPSGPGGKRARTAEGGAATTQHVQVQLRLDGANDDEAAGLITIRGVAYEEKLLDELPQGERDAVLMEATRQFAAAFRGGGGVERSVLENNTRVGGYPENVHDYIAATVYDIIEDRGRAIGPLTVATFKELIRGSQMDELALQIMAEAERLAIDEVLERPNGQLLGRHPRTKRQTFAESDRALVIKHVRSAIRAVTFNRAICALYH